MEVNYIIKKLNLKRHPEGGYFKEIYRCDELIQKESLPNRYNSHRNFSTSIYYLLQNNDFSAFHRLKSDEIWHFYKGSPLILHVINKDVVYKRHILGNALNNKESFQIVIKKGDWFAAEVKNKESFSLLGCTVAPGFDFNDFEMGQRSVLLEMYPKHSAIINKLTRI